MDLTSLPRDTLHFPAHQRPFLEPHLPPADKDKGFFTTLTFATSLDSQLALSPGAPTALSGPQSKAMTHYLRSRHDAILIGVGTAIADDPSLNCRLEGVGGYGGKDLEGQPRPVVLDPSARWKFTERSKLFNLANQGRGRAPIIITANHDPPEEQKTLLEKFGGKYMTLKISKSDVGEHKLDWNDVVRVLKDDGLSSVMIEGGGQVINSLLSPDYAQLISSVIITIAPTWLGRGGVVVSPPRRFDDDKKPMAAARLKEVEWHPFGEDVVLCGRVKL
nr:2,5-diamino-6-ribosylamino-4(3h)-pyrimidinone 5'-phosphate reductase [Quercus suber]